MIIIEKLHKKYASKTVLNQINFEFKKGNIYGVVGKNGAGKTTLFKCITGLEKYNGKIYCTEGILKHKLGYLETESFFFEKMTGKEYIELLCSARNINLKNIDDKNIFNLPLNSYVQTYSTGMKKKLALLAVLLQKNEYFILDEPFNGVDIQSNILIVEIIKELKRLKKTVLISSHIFSTLYESCDCILHLENGKFNSIIEKSEFTAFEQRIKQKTIGNQIKNLNL